MRRIYWSLLLAGAACSGTPTSPNAPSGSPTPINLAGIWTLETHASASCSSLPTSGVDRTYPSLVRITQNGPTLSIDTTTSFGPFPTMRTALIGVANIHDRLTLSDNYGSGVLDIDGTFTAAAISNRISGPLDGRYTVSGKDCVAADHTITFTR